MMWGWGYNVEVVEKKERCVLENTMDMHFFMCIFSRLTSQSDGLIHKAERPLHVLAPIIWISTAKEERLGWICKDST